MSAISTLWRYGPRIFVGAIALISISSDIALFFREMELTKDLPSDAMMTQFIPLAITTVFFIGIQVQRITACFTSTTIFAQLAFYIWTVECFFKTCFLFGSIALSYNKDFAEKMLAKSKDPSANKTYSGPIFWTLFYGSYGVGVGLKMILNGLRRRDREVERQREALLRIAKDMAPFPITTAGSLPGFSDVVPTEEEARRRLLRVRTWPRAIAAFLFSALMVDAIATFFDGERVVGLRWYQQLEFFGFAINTCVGLCAIYRKSLRLSRGYFCTFVGLVLYGTYFSIKGLVKVYRKNNPSSISMVTSLADVLSADDVTAQDFPFAEAALNAIIDLFVEFPLGWLMWLIIKDLEERDDRIAKARIASRAAAAHRATFTDEKGAVVHNVYSGSRQQAHVVMI